MRVCGGAGRKGGAKGGADAALPLCTAIYLAHWAFLATYAAFFMHVQVSTRCFLSPDCETVRSDLSWEPIIDGLAVLIALLSGPQAAVVMSSPVLVGDQPVQRQACPGSVDLLSVVRSAEPRFVSAVLSLDMKR